jgi:hypothetical protein
LEISQDYNTNRGIINEKNVKSIISNCFQNYFESALKKSRSSNFEVLYLQYIDFLTYEVQVPLLAYIHLKKYEAKFKRSSIYFKSLTNLRIH